MRKQMKKKLKDKSGESIVETMVAVLVSAMAMTMLAGAITSGMKLITESRTAMDEYFTAANAMSSESTSEASEKGTLSDVKITMVNKTTDSSVDAVNLKGITSTDATTLAGNVDYYKNKKHNIVTYHLKETP